MKEHILTIGKCSLDDTCDFINADLEKKIEEFIRLGAVPHCCFMDLITQPLLVNRLNSTTAEVDLFASITAFYEYFAQNVEHFHCTVMTLSELLAHKPIIRFHTIGGAFVELSGPESAKLVAQAISHKNILHDANSQNIEVEDGQQMTFSSPEPELPAGFIDFLSSVFSPLDEIAEVYAFEMLQTGQQTGNLVVGVVPARPLGREEADRLSFLILDGVEQHIHDREQLDFMVIEDDELRKIAAAISPNIALNRS